MKRIITTTLLAVFLLTGVVSAQTAQPAWAKDAMGRLSASYGASFDAPAKARLSRGMNQVASFWRTEDGDAAAFEEFVRTNFAADEAMRNTMFSRFEDLLEKLDGHMGEIGREFRNQTDLVRGPILPFDETFAAYSPSAHIADDFFSNKLAFVVLLNFPLTTLEQRLGEGTHWTRRQWADAKLALTFAHRVPADVNQSDVDFSVVNGKIHFGLAAIKGCGGSASEALVKERKKRGPFRDIFDLCERVDATQCGKGPLETLIKAGAMDCFGATRKQLATVLERALQSGAAALDELVQDAPARFGDFAPRNFDGRFAGAIVAGVVVVPIDYRSSPDFLVRVAGIVEARLVLAGDDVPLQEAP